MSPELNHNQEIEPARRLFGILQQNLAEHGYKYDELEPDLDRDPEDKEDYQGRELSGIVTGPRGQNPILIREVTGEWPKKDLAELYGTETEEAIRLDFELADSFLVGPDVVAKIIDHTLTLEKVDDFEIEWIIEDLGF